MYHFYLFKWCYFDRSVCIIVDGLWSNRQSVDFLVQHQQKGGDGAIDASHTRIAINRQL